MADTAKFGILRKLLRALGLSEAAVNDLFDWIADRLADEQVETVTPTSAPVFPYRVRDDFLSPAEHSFYQVLKNVVGGRVQICPKVSLSDLFYVKSSDPSEWRIYTNKIDRKHVDFVLCDPQTMTPLAGVELDDKSHQRADRKARDGFVEGVFATAGLELLRVPVKRGYQPQELAALIDRIVPAPDGGSISMPSSTPVASLEISANGATGNGNHVSGENNPANQDAEKSVVVSSPMCPKCGSEMKLRTAKKGDNQGQQFWGCSNFPRCRAMVAHEPVGV